MSYQDIYEQIFSEPFAIQFSGKGIDLGESLEIPYYPFGFPPGIIPLATRMSVGPVVYGYWIPWFSERKPYFCVSYLSDNPEVIKVAETELEFIKFLLFELIDLDTERDTVADLGNLFGIDNIDPYYDFYRRNGHPENSARLFDSDGGSIIDTTDVEGIILDDMSSYELTSTLLENIEPDDLPLWYTRTDKLELFREFIHAELYKEAWLTVNSTGWTFPDAISAVDVLASLNTNGLFIQQMNEWKVDNSTLPDSY